MFNQLLSGMLTRNAQNHLISHKERKRKIIRSLFSRYRPAILATWRYEAVKLGVQGLTGLRCECKASLTDTGNPDSEPKEGWRACSVATAEGREVGFS